MGLTAESIRFLAEHWRVGDPVREVITLGRQDLWASPKRLESILRGHGLWAPGTDATGFRQSLAAAPWRLAELLHRMGAASVEACDVSGYEGASLLHDMNRPIPEEWEQRCDLLLDGGTLEHVFQLPVALSNCMRLVRTGGRVVLFTPANNYCGHGFYQFSPELFWRVFSEAEGFRVERMHAMVDTEGFSSFFGVRYPFPIRSRRYAVADPARLGRRILLINGSPVLLFVEARKVAHRRPFMTAPQQSDYAAHWQTNQPPTPLSQPGWRGAFALRLRRSFPEQVWREWLPWLAGWFDLGRAWRFRRRHSFADRSAYEPVCRSRETWK